MRSIAMFGALAVFATAPLAAQGFRTGDINPRRTSTNTAGQVLGGVLSRDTVTRRGNRKSDRIPPGQMPPAGMCRIWIDGVPPGQQPAPTDCQTAVATKPANARVIFGGDGTSFPGKGNGKFKNRERHRDNDDEDDDRDDDDRNDDDRDEARGRNTRAGVLGSVIPGTRQDVGEFRGKGRGKGKGKGGD